MTIISTTVGRNPLEEWSSHHGQQESKMQYLRAVSKWQNDLHHQGKPFNSTVIQVYAPTSNAKEAEVEWFYEDLQDVLELTPKKWCPFHCRGLECKSRKSRDTWLLLLLLSRISHVWLCATPYMEAHQAPLSLGFSRQGHWSGLPFPSPQKRATDR